MSQYYVNGGGGPTPGAGIETLTGNSGGAVSADGANNVNTVGTGSVTVVGNPGTNTLTAQLTGLTNHNLLVGAGTATITKVAPSATSGIPVISQGAAADPAFGTAVVAGGGTGNTTFTPYSVICAGTTATGTFQNVSGVGTSGQVLTSNGAAALPTWQAAGSGGITTIAGNTGTATGSTVNFHSTATAGATTSFSASASTVNLNLADSKLNIILGTNTTTAGLGLTSGSNIGMGDSSLANLTGASIVGNVAIGGASGYGISNGSSNTFLGNGAGGGTVGNFFSSSFNIGIGDGCMSNLFGGPCIPGDGNIGIGGSCLQNVNASVYNTVIGYQGLIAAKGSYNLCLGYLVGSAYTTTESSNILLSNAGVAAESNVIRIGTQGSGNSQQNKCFIAGIGNSTVTGSAVFVDTSTGQLGLTSSSKRFKKDIEPIQSTRVTDLEPVSFVYKSDTQERLQFGLIAEQVAEVIPELVEYRDDEPYTVHYHMLAPLLLAEIRALKARIEKLENVI